MGVSGQTKGLDIIFVLRTMVQVMLIICCVKFSLPWLFMSSISNSSLLFCPGISPRHVYNKFCSFALIVLPP